MALWNSGATWSSGQLWGPSTPAGPPTENTSNTHTKMLRQPYYPRSLKDRSEWHINFASKLPGYAAALALTPAETDSAVADNLVLGYGLGGWIVAMREHATACTSSLDTLEAGSGTTNYEFPVVQLPPPPVLPAGITGVKPGALLRTFDLVGIIKRRPGYTEAMGLDLGIVGPAAPPPPPPGESPPPELKERIIAGDLNQYVRLGYFKRGHEYVMIESRRGGGGWEPLAQSNKSPYIDTRALLTPGQAEVREYRARFWDNALPSSGWCDVVQITVGP
jgi:hypothetical protein